MHLVGKNVLYTYIGLILETFAKYCVENRYKRIVRYVLVYSQSAVGTGLIIFSYLVLYTFVFYLNGLFISQTNLLYISLHNKQ